MDGFIASLTVGFAKVFSVIALATLVALITAVPLAWICAKSKSPLAAIAYIVLKLPLLFPPTVVALILLLLTSKHMAPIDIWICNAAGSSISSLPHAVLVGAAMAFPVVYHISLGAFRLIDGTLLDVARVYGVLQWRIALPLARRDLALAAVCGFTRAFGEIGILFLISFSEFDFSDFSGGPFAIFFTILATIVSVVAIMDSSRRL
jgi:ABC-type molybdate transport system permease subunit